jgi:hypothetical protein
VRKKPRSGFSIFKANFDLLPFKVCTKIVKVKLLATDTAALNLFWQRCMLFL